MRAIVFNRFGPASDVLEMTELPMPEPAPGEVLVRLHTSAVNPSDVKKRAGAFPDLLADGFVIPHSDGAGVITAVGLGVAPTRVGERVFVYQAQHGRRYGTAAEYVAVDARRASLLPASVDFAVGACIGIPIMTAHRCITADGPVTDQWVLVTGGAGRVGHYAIQWARHLGARVIATASNPRDAKRCQQAGAARLAHLPAHGHGQREFRTPGLREVATHPPYMHTGALATLEDVVAFYSRGIGRRERPAPAETVLEPLGLTPEQEADLVLFLRCLTSDQPVDASAKAR